MHGRNAVFSIHSQEIDFSKRFPQSPPFNTSAFVRQSSAYGVNVWPLMVERVLLSRILRLCQGVNLRGRQIAGREHKGKVPTGQAAYDQYLDPSISPSLSRPTPESVHSTAHNAKWTEYAS